MKTIWNWIMQEKHLWLGGEYLFGLSVLSLFVMKYSVFFIVFMTIGFILSFVAFVLLLKTYAVPQRSNSWKRYTFLSMSFVASFVVGLLFQSPLGEFVWVCVKIICACIVCISIAYIFNMLKSASPYWQTAVTGVVLILTGILYAVLGYQYPDGSSLNQFFATMRLPFIFFGVIFFLGSFSVRVKQKPYKKLDNTDTNMKA